MSAKLSGRPILQGRESHSHASSWRGSQARLGPQQGTDDQVLLTAAKSPGPKVTISPDLSACRHNTPAQLSLRFCYWLKTKHSVLSSRSITFCPVLHKITFFHFLQPGSISTQLQIWFNFKAKQPNYNKLNNSFIIHIKCAFANVFMQYFSGQIMPFSILQQVTGIWAVNLYELKA